jgi:hypothetical protein
VLARNSYEKSATAVEPFCHGNVATPAHAHWGAAGESRRFEEAFDEEGMLRGQSREDLSRQFRRSLGGRQMSVTTFPPARGFVVETTCVASVSRTLFSSSPDCVRKIHARLFGAASAIRHT